MLHSDEAPAWNLLGLADRSVRPVDPEAVHARGVTQAEVKAAEVKR